ncbi:OLC1v1023463C1 [Oldenlandia corymbosa var. corymbosa]|uniref:OLC1v1023463C1 n=1 Tax=Oldenlandia corymbosa var. corymbosa TaxID=529605 RepID=A0AAV1C0V8_OLDCO|nr:OLC1v1023463C1 [Oldenlandia corymbosa var. corymbosa]
MSFHGLLVSALGLHGHAHEALQKFREMEVAGIVPDKVVYTAVISACRHVGLVQQGFELFGEMKTKYGHLKEAQDVIAWMPFPPNDSIWRSFLDGCKRKGFTELAVAA